jgi:hypothetical protein
MAQVSEIQWVKGGRVRWNVGRKKWLKNDDLMPQSESDVVQAFERGGYDLAKTTISKGTLHSCPRCNGSGIFSGGPCFRCYGNMSTWIEVNA